MTPPGDPPALAHHLLELVEGDALRRQLGVNARLTIENHWTWDIQGARLSHVLQLARERHPGGRS